jgi:hypothetical protein
VILTPAWAATRLSGVPAATLTVLPLKFTSTFFGPPVSPAFSLVSNLETGR